MTKLRLSRILISIVAIVLQLLQPAILTANAANLVTDFKQCANKDTTLGNCHWIGSIVQQSNSKYYEGMSVPQRTLFTGITATGSNVHTLTFSHQATKAGIHAYDFLTSYDQAVAAAAAAGNPINNLFPCGPDIGPPASLATTCSLLRATAAANTATPSVPNDPFVSKDGSTQDRINAYETEFGDRTIKLYADSPITGAGLTLAHSVPNNGDTGDSDISYVLTWTSSSDKLLLEMAGHLSLSGDGTGSSWGAGKGSSQISGGPYHFNLSKLDNSSLGSQDNQIKGADILPPPSGTLTVIKHVINDNGGTAVAGDFTMNVTGTNVSDPSFPGEEDPGTTVTLDPGSYSANETPISGYNVSLSADCSGVIATGEHKTCTIINDDDPAHLIVIKHVINDNGGTNLASDFSMTINGVTANGGNTFNGAETPGVDKLVTPGNYSVTESGPGGYASDFSADCTGTIALGETKTCTVTNNDITAQLTVIKHVVADNGGNEEASDFTMNVNGTNVSDPSFPGAEEPGTTVTLNAGIYSVTETGPDGYTESDSLGCSGTIALGEHKFCTITNDDQIAHITLIKVVQSNHGGNAQPDDFGISLDGNTVLSGSTSEVSSNTAITIDEAGLAGYDFVSLTGENCPSVLGGTVTLDEGQSITCTITNTDQPAHIILSKIVNNNHGGEAGPNDFGISIDGTSVISGSSSTVNSNTAHSLDEAGLLGYQFVSLGGDAKCPTILGGSVTLNEGESVSCVITNEDIAPQLIVIKHVVNDDGGNNIASDFTMQVTGGNVSDPTFAGSEAGVTVTLDAGSYSADEAATLGYTKTLSVDCSGSIAIGESKTCTITNDDQPAHIILTKIVNNNHGGTAGPNAFGISIDGDIVASGSTTDVAANSTHVLNEVGLAGYQFDSIGGDAKCPIALGDGLILSEGETVSCTITNSDIAPRLIVIKHVINDNGGTKAASDFTMNVIGTNVSSPSFPGAEDPGTTVTLDAGGYSVDEAIVTGYAKTLSADCTGAIALGETKSCTVTNNDIAPSLTLIKNVVNDNGGTAVPTDWILSADGPTPISGPGGVVSGPDFSAGLYNLSESGVTGYQPTNWTCSIPMPTLTSIALKIGDSVICQITNDDSAPHLIVIKHVINDNGGTAVAGDFTIHVAGINVSPDTFPGSESGTNITLDIGNYAVTEDPNTNYVANFSADCTGAIALGETKTCIVTNDDRAATRTLGFWQTHTSFTNSIFATNFAGGMQIGISPHKGVITNITLPAQSQLYGAYYSSIPNKTDGTKRSGADKARMQLLQQLVSAKLNCAAFGCTGGTQALITNADAAYASGNITQILSYAGQLDAYNNSGDDVTVNNTGSATPLLSQSLANKVFWNAP